MKVRNSFSMGLAGMTLLSLGAFQAQAQTTTPDASLSLALSDEAGKTSGILSSSTINSLGMGVGYSASAFPTVFSAAKTSATAQSVYNGLTFGSSFNAGSTLQIGVQAYALNEADSSRPPVTVYASIYTYNPNAAAGTVPIGTAVVKDAAIQIKANTTIVSSNTYYSGLVTTGAALVAGQDYVLAISAASSAGQAPTDYAVLAERTFSQSGQTDTIFRNQFITDTNDLGDGGVSNPLKSPSLGSANPIAFQIYALNGPATVPGPESVALFALGMTGLPLLKRRRARA